MHCGEQVGGDEWFSVSKTRQEKARKKGKPIPL
jgi:hypothetical protein